MFGLDSETVNLLAGTFLVALLLVIAAIGTKVIEAYRRKAHGDDQDESDPEASFRKALEAGELGPEEFERIRASLQRRDGASESIELKKGPPQT